MDTSMEIFQELEIFRTPEQMKYYFQNKKEEILSSKEYTDSARFKNGRFKEFLEEFYPFYLFSQSQYIPDNAEVRIVVGNQPYDGLIRYQSGDIRKVEFTQYIEGDLDRLDAIKLQERGYSNARFCDTKDLQTRADIYFEKVVANATKKANKNYEGVMLIIIVNTFFYLDIWKLDTSLFITNLITELLRLPFNSESLYILALNNNPVEFIDNNIYKVF